MQNINRQWLLKNRPEGLVSDTDFEYRESPAPRPKSAEALIRTLYFSFDPTQRGWLNDAPGYVAPVKIGEPMRAEAIGEVIESNRADLRAGDLVCGTMSWQDFVLASAAAETIESGVLTPIRKITGDFPPTYHLGVLGITGLTAYVGMLEVGALKSGDTVLVSGAAGATGSVAGQIAKLKGARVIGIAGGADKCRWLTAQAGFDAAIDYRSERVSARLRELAPRGIDLFFDNVGGDTLDSALLNLAQRARVVICGGISSGYGTKIAPGPKHYMQLVFKAARMEGFLVLTYRHRFPEAIAALSDWVATGKIRVAEDIVEGFENAPATLRRLFEGKNLGKQLLKVTRL
jgi:NADPH-dependent curcumin reductase CurA